MYDQDKADKVVKFVKLLRHTQGNEWAKKPFNLLEYQEETLRSIFGNIDNEGNREVREAFLFWPRKNGKTEFAAALGLYMLFGDGEFGAEIYCAANSRDQATKVFQAAAAMVRMNKALRKR